MRIYSLEWERGVLEFTWDSDLARNMQFMNMHGLRYIGYCFRENSLNLYGVYNYGGIFYYT